MAVAHAPAAQDEIVTTAHVLETANGELAYTAHAGRMVLNSEAGEARAHVFHVAYLLDGVEEQSERPVTFCYNGGPGSSSVWLHMGTFGPRRVLMDPEGRPLPPPAQVVPNEHGLLAFTDLVFIDPPAKSVTVERTSDRVRHGGTQRLAGHVDGDQQHLLGAATQPAEHVSGAVDELDIPAQQGGLAPAPAQQPARGE